MATPLRFPDRFLWGAATAAHQVEGNNVNSDAWLLEHLPNTIFAEPSGDACDHYHRYAEDIALLATLGFNTYRFSVEWARVEPIAGEIDATALDHYEAVVDGCLERGLAPVVTFNHFTSPHWFAARGAWLDTEAPGRSLAALSVVTACPPHPLKNTKAYLIFRCTLGNPARQRMTGWDSMAARAAYSAGVRPICCLNSWEKWAWSK